MSATSLAPRLKRVNDLLEQSRSHARHCDTSSAAAISALREAVDVLAEEVSELLDAADWLIPDERSTP